MSFAIGFVVGAFCGGLLVAALFIHRAIRVGRFEPFADYDPDNYNPGGTD